MDLLVMGRHEAQRLRVVQSAIDGKLSNQAAAERLGISRSQFKRLRRQVRERGEEGVIHGNRGRQSLRRLADSVTTLMLCTTPGTISCSTAA